MNRKLERFIRCCSCAVVLIFVVVLILAFLAQGNSAKIIAFDKQREISVKPGTFDFQLLAPVVFSDYPRLTEFRLTGELATAGTVTVYPTDLGFMIDFHEPVTELRCCISSFGKEIDVANISISVNNAENLIYLYVVEGELHWQLLDELLPESDDGYLENTLLLSFIAAAGILYLRHIALRQAGSDVHSPSNLTYDDFLSGKV